MDVWDDPRSLTTFRTFHHSNGNGHHNSGISETSFYPQTNGNHEENGGNDEQALDSNKNRISNLHTLSSENVLRNKLANSRVKGKTLNHVKPVTPPQTFKDLSKFDRNSSVDDGRTSSGGDGKSPNVSANGRSLKPFSADLENYANGDTKNEGEDNGSTSGNGLYVTKNGNGDVLLVVSHLIYSKLPSVKLRIDGIDKERDVAPSASGKKHLNIKVKYSKLRIKLDFKNPSNYLLITSDYFIFYFCI